MKKTEEKRSTRESVWINNQVPIWKHIIKPCKYCGYCPYGRLVEEYRNPEFHDQLPLIIMNILKKPS